MEKQKKGGCRALAYVNFSAAWGKDPEGTKYGFEDEASILFQLTCYTALKLPYDTLRPPTYLNCLLLREYHVFSIVEVSKDVWTFSRPFTRGFFEEGARSMAIRLRSQEGVWVMASTPLSPDTKQTNDNLGSANISLVPTAFTTCS
ncbi:hypothetical protein DL96DRAFT_1804174 [Flagelloscypha sp. PMI_526]|nr:hypothetical protein DL96DRAFT_1748021 [Flagelloscypha sp. PMI_526]KAH8795252.1 hypothetical protein DL96DRAFT_1804174 [Flagelloscypha sp. PMI_526]